MHKICVPGNFSIGGPRSFQQKLTVGLRRMGLEVVHDWDESGLDAVLLIGGTRMWIRLWQMKMGRIPIVQRLDGVNWTHRVRYPGPKKYLMSEVRNWMMSAHTCGYFACQMRRTST